VAYIGHVMAKKKKNRNVLFVAGLALAVSAPAGFSLLTYKITKNPAFLPLARTENDEAIYKGAIIANKIHANIRWTTGRQKNFSQDDLRVVITNAFKVHGVRVAVVFEEVNSTDRVSITYKVGRNQLGPHTISKAADSIRGAVAVYRMYQMGRPKS